MANLQLSLKKQWFELTKAGVKTEDYREITPYWLSRLCTHNLRHRSLKWWENYLKNAFDVDFEFKHFESNIMTLGYPKSTDSERILKLEHKGIEIGCGNPELGAEPNKLYFIIKHGRIIK